MANSLSNLEAIVQQAFLVGLAESTQDYARCCEVKGETGAQLQLMAANSGGIAQEISGTTSSVSPTDMTSGISLTSQRFWVLSEKVPMQYVDVLASSLLQDAAATMANAAAQNINKLYFDGLEGLFSQAHPSAGAGAGQVGAGKKFIDTGLAYLQTEAGAGTNSNLLTAALSESSLDAAKQLLRRYKNQRGLPMNMGATNRNALIVSETNEKLARQLMGSAFTSSELQQNVFAGFADVIVFPFTTDADDWFLVDVQKSPVGIWIGQQPEVSITPSDNNVFWNITCKFNASFYIRSHEYGIVGSNVP